MKSCVSLLSAVCGQPEPVMDRWLDLYYQVRHAQEKADAAARTAERLKEAEPFIIPGTLEAVTGPPQSAAPTAPPEGEPRSPSQSPPRAAVTAPPKGEPRAKPEPLREKDLPKEDPSQSAEERVAPSQALRASSPQGASQESAEDEEPSQSAAPTAPPEGAPRAKPEPEPLREKDLPKEEHPQAAAPEKAVKRPSQIGNTRGHDAAVFKRQVRDRLEAVRKRGVSAPSIVRAATTAGAFTPNNIYEILEGKVLRIEIYRALDEALRHFEN